MIATRDDFARNIARCLACDDHATNQQGRIVCGASSRPDCHVHWRALASNSLCPRGLFGTPLPVAMPCGCTSDDKE